MITSPARRSAFALALLFLSGAAATACASAPVPVEAESPSTSRVESAESGSAELDSELSSWRRDWSAYFCDASVLALGDERCLELEAEAVVLADRALTEISLSDASQSEDLMHALAETNDAITGLRSAGCESDRVASCDELGARLGDAIKNLAYALEG